MHAWRPRSCAPFPTLGGAEPGPPGQAAHLWQEVAASWRWTLAQKGLPLASDHTAAFDGAEQLPGADSFAQGVLHFGLEKGPQQFSALWEHSRPQLFKKTHGRSRPKANYNPELPEMLTGPVSPNSP